MTATVLAEAAPAAKAQAVVDEAAKVLAEVTAAAKARAEAQEAAEAQAEAMAAAAKESTAFSGLEASPQEALHRGGPSEVLKDTPAAEERWWTGAVHSVTEFPFNKEFYTTQEFANFI